MELICTNIFVQPQANKSRWMRMVEVYYLLFLYPKSKTVSYLASLITAKKPLLR